MTIISNPNGFVKGKAYQVNSRYLVYTAQDTTSPQLGPTINNSSGDVSAIFASALVTDKTGTSPTVQLTLNGAADPAATVFGALKDTSGNAITSGTAVSISGAAPTTPVEVGPLQTTAAGVTNFPAAIAVGVTIGGSATPGFTGIVSVNVTRRQRVDIFTN